MAILQSATFAIFIALILIAARSDAKTLRIPNWISLALLADFLAATLASNMALQDIAISLGVGVGALVVGFVLFFLRWFGGGDAKLYAAIALWMGWPLVVYFSIAVMLLGGAVAVIAVVLRKGLGLWPDWVVNSARGLFEKNKAVPYGLAIVAGALVMVPKMALLPAGWLELMRVVVL